MKWCTVKGGQTSLENLELKAGAERLATSRGAGRAGEVLDCGCEQVAGSMHSTPKNAEWLKKTDPWTLHRVTTTISVLLNPISAKMWT